MSTILVVMFIDRSGHLHEKLWLFLQRACGEGEKDGEGVGGGFGEGASVGRQAARHATHTHTYHTHATHFRRMTLPVPIQAGFAFLPYYATHAKSMPQRDTSRDRGGVPRISTP